MDERRYLVQTPMATQLVDCEGVRVALGLIPKIDDQLFADLDLTLNDALDHLNSEKQQLIIEINGGSPLYSFVVDEHVIISRADDYYGIFQILGEEAFNKKVAQSSE
ncbi:hypothetical protein AAAK29_31265 [Mesorhizobium sp. CCNWLW179-1]|uniref:hypothetical protein n=1 Tax=unclassified Mesorhizobium TaxID=325217 RepID=UPI00301492D5